MLPPGTCGVNMIGILATPGDIWRLAGELLCCTLDCRRHLGAASHMTVDVGNSQIYPSADVWPAAHVSRTFAPDGARRSCGW
jgi:hypothetical protein